MKEMKQILDNKLRPMLRLGEIERIIRKHRLIVPPPGRSMLLRLCEDGTFETVGTAPTKLGWLVYEDSFWKWITTMGGVVPGKQ